ncbi:MAG: hypothetical protein WCW27_06140 [Patescibacteria group bacterium]
MIEHLFGSRTRLKLLQLLFTHPTAWFYVRELSRTVHEHINSIRRELANLEAIGLLEKKVEQRKTFYQVKSDFLLYTELKALVLKSQLIHEKKFLRRLEQAGKIELLLLLGHFIGDTQSAIDLFIVGNLSNKHIQVLLEEFNQRFGQNLRYTVMTLTEYQYRRDVTDKFLFNLLQAPQIVLVDNLALKKN